VFSLSVLAKHLFPIESNIVDFFMGFGCALLLVGAVVLMKKKKSNLLGILMIFFVCTVSAQSSAEKTGSLLWKISGNGLAHPSYIFGTHHLFPISFLDSVPGINQAFAASQQMVGELVMGDMMALGGELQKAGMMPQDSTWQMLLSEDDYRFVDEQLTQFFGAGLQALGILKPSILNMTYAIMFYQRTFQTNPAEAADMLFQQLAATRQIPVLGLETVQDQIDAIINFSSLERQAADFVCTLKNTNYLVLSAKRLNQLYRSADLTGLSEMLREEGPCPWSDEQEAALNDSRNRRWLEKLPAIMADKPGFIAVGCMHLVGEAGLLVGLEKAGYKVEAVRE
jgi:uncharacterized protein YbaP (TraB family)